MAMAVRFYDPTTTVTRHKIQLSGPLPEALVFHEAFSTFFLQEYSVLAVDMFR